MDNRPVLSICIVNYKVEDLLRKCLNSIYESISCIAFETIIVDNNSGDGSVEMIKSIFPQANSIENKENVGFSKANNQAISIANGKYILLLNPDTIVKHHAIEKMVKFMENHQSVGILGCKLLNSDGSKKIQWTSCGSFPTLFNVFLWQSLLEKLFYKNRIFGMRQMTYWQRDTNKEVDWISGACMLIRREVINDIGLLDESFFSYFEDTDFCYRAKKKKWIVYFLADAHIIHIGGQSWNLLHKKAIENKLENIHRFFMKYYGELPAFMCELLILYGSLLRSCIWTILFLTNRDIRYKRKLEEHKEIIKWCIKNISLPGEEILL